MTYYLCKGHSEMTEEQQALVRESFAKVALDAPTVAPMLLPVTSARFPCNLKSIAEISRWSCE